MHYILAIIKASHISYKTKYFIILQFVNNKIYGTSCKG